MSEPSITYHTKQSDPNELFFVTLNDGFNIVVLHPAEAVAIYRELGRVLRRFGHLEDDREESAEDTS